MKTQQEFKRELIEALTTLIMDPTITIESLYRYNGYSRLANRYPLDTENTLNGEFRIVIDGHDLKMKQEFNNRKIEIFRSILPGGIVDWESQKI